MAAMEQELPLAISRLAMPAVFVFVVPTLSLFAASRARARGHSQLLSVAVVGGMSWGVFILALGALSTLGEHRGLDEGPTELSGLMVILPSVAAGLLGLLWVARRPDFREPAPPADRSPFSVRVRVCAAVACALASVASTLWLYDGHTWRAHRLLPDSAEILEESALTEPFLSDYAYRIRARMSEDDFHHWTEQLGVEPGPDEEERGDEQCWSSAQYEDGVGTYSANCM